MLDEPDKLKKTLEIREFFTQEIGRKGYGTLSFLDDSKFTTTERNMNGFITAEYMTEIAPYEFLNKVAAFLETNEKLAEKRKSIYNIFEMKANKIGNNKIILEQPTITEEQKNAIASKVLAKYIKFKK